MCIKIRTQKYYKMHSAKQKTQFHTKCWLKTVHCTSIVDVHCTNIEDVHCTSFVDVHCTSIIDNCTVIMFLLILLASHGANCKLQFCAANIYTKMKPATKDYRYCFTRWPKKLTLSKKKNRNNWPFCSRILECFNGWV